MKVLLKVSKLVPKLGTANEHEKLATVCMIEKLLANEGISWTDVGQQLSDFVVNVLKFEEDEELEPPKAKPEAEEEVKTNGWTTAPAAPVAAQGWTQTQQAFRQQSAQQAWQTRPPQRPQPKRVDPRVRGTAAQRTELIEELIRRKLWKDSKEQGEFQKILMSVQVGLPLAAKLEELFEEASKKI
jgi:hypothetical protein